MRIIVNLYLDSCTTFVASIRYSNSNCVERVAHAFSVTVDPVYCPLASGPLNVVYFGPLRVIYRTSFAKIQQ